MNSVGLMTLNSFELLDRAPLTKRSLIQKVREFLVQMGCMYVFLVAVITISYSIFYLRIFMMFVW